MNLPLGFWLGVFVVAGLMLALVLLLVLEKTP